MDRLVLTFEEIEYIETNLIQIFAIAHVIHDLNPERCKEIIPDFLKTLPVYIFFESGVTLDIFFQYCRQELNSLTVQDEFHIVLKGAMKTALIYESEFRELIEAQQQSIQNLFDRLNLNMPPSE